MSSPDVSSPRCRVIDGAKLPQASGGAPALCAAIEKAVAMRGPNIAFTAEVRVLSSSRLAATLTRDGRRLPEQGFASMDRELSANSFERFAAALADEVAKGQQ
jgi:hypothetical protein